MKVAIIGSRSYSNISLIKSTIERLKFQYNDDLIIVSGGCLEGTDAIVKEIVLNDEQLFGCYIEFPPKHFEYNEYCYYDEHYYSKEYHVSNYHVRNEDIAMFCDKAILFVSDKSNLSSGSASAKRFLDKYNKKYLVIDG